MRRGALANALTECEDQRDQAGSPRRSVQEISHGIGKRSHGISQIPNQVDQRRYDKSHCQQDGADQRGGPGDCKHVFHGISFYKK